MIPKIIHYCWFGKNPLPHDVKKCIESWKKYCPEYEIKCWTEENYDIQKNQFLLEAYKNRAWAFVSDYARLDIIYTNGGIYLDTDVELIKSLDFLLNEQCYLGIQQKDNYINTGLGFGAEKDNKVIGILLSAYDELVFDKSILNQLSCPILNTESLEKFGYIKENKYQTILNASIFPSIYFDPYASGTSQSLMCDKTVSIHHYSASWTKSSQRFKRKLVRIIGTKNINKIKNILRKDDKIEENPK